MESPGSAKIKYVAHPKHQEEEKTSPNRNYIITSKQRSTLPDWTRKWAWIDYRKQLSGPPSFF